MEVLSCEKKGDKYLITVKDSPFYVDGKGGQLGDRGSIGNTKVLEVLSDEKIYVSHELIPGEYKYEIDKKRQEDIAVQHSSQHIFSAVGKTFYDYNTVGFRMGEEYTTVDFDSEIIKKETIEKMEYKVNEIISNSIGVETFVRSEDEAREIQGLRKSISEKVVGDVRFVKIGDVDLGACAGFHVENTSRIKIFKIINYEKLSGKTRFYFLAGERAYNDYSYKCMMAKELTQLFSCKNYEILEMIDKTIEHKNSIERELKHISVEYAKLLSEKLVKDAPEISGHKIVYCDGIGSESLKKEMSGDFVLITKNNANYTIISKTVNCKDLVNFIKEKLGVVGGGSSTKANFKRENINKQDIIGCVTQYLKG